MHYHLIYYYCMFRIVNKLFCRLNSEKWVIILTKKKITGYETTNTHINTLLFCVNIKDKLIYDQQVYFQL